MAGHEKERQERALITRVNMTVKQNKGNPITIVTDGASIAGVIKAEKMRMTVRSGAEPYTDIILHLLTPKGKEKLHVSMKGCKSPSLAGGGISGIDLVSPGLTRKFLKSVYARLLGHLKAGDKVPDTFGRISKLDRIKVVMGHPAMGGPIDYLYIGPMTLTGDYSPTKNQLYLNGNMFVAKQYAQSHELYLRLRARSIDQRFDPSAKDMFGTPKIYGGFPGRPNSPGRVDVTDWVTRTAMIIQL